MDALPRRHLGAQWQQRSAACVCGEDVQRKKPDPQACHLAPQAMGIDPLQTCALEDSPGGVAAARATDVPVVVVRSSYFADAAIDGAVAIGPNLGSRQGRRPALEGEGGGHVTLNEIARWCGRMELVAQH